MLRVLFSRTSFAWGQTWAWLSGGTIRPDLGYRVNWNFRLFRLAIRIVRGLAVATE